MANFSQIYKQYVEQVYCFLRGLSGNDKLAEELTWKAFYQAFLHIDSFENSGDVFDWLCEIGERVYLKKMKRRKRNSFEDKYQIPALREKACIEGARSWGEVNAAERIKRIRRGLRKIRRRWVCSVMAATALILLMLAGALLVMGGVPAMSRANIIDFAACLHA